MLLKCAAILGLVVCVIADTLENQTEIAIKAGNGKTYFIQVKKTGDGENAENATYTKISHYKDEGRGRVKEALLKQYVDMFGILDVAEPENIRVPPEDVEFKDPVNTPNYIDEEWSFNVNHSTYDLPNITYEIYEAMLENNKHNTVINATTVKFFFETDTNLTSNMIKFNLDSLDNITDKIVDAELHVYRLPRGGNTTKPNSSDNVVRLYQINKSGEHEDNSTEIKPDEHKLANVIYISSNYAGWQVFKVKNVVENWQNGDENLGFLISTTDSNDHEYSVEFAHRERNGGKYQPSLVVYLDRQETVTRTPSQPKKKPYKMMKVVSELMKKNYNPCTRHVWYISFHELGWNNFIISPNGYMAYKCKGSCNAPLTTPYTNHGKMLNILQRSSNSVTPCCVPNAYRSLLIMFYDKQSNVVIKEYDDMIVNGCACR